jgi:hypothetical protein
VTGVQTCALPIFDIRALRFGSEPETRQRRAEAAAQREDAELASGQTVALLRKAVEVIVFTHD